MALGKYTLALSDYEYVRVRRGDDQGCIAIGSR